MSLERPQLHTFHGHFQVVHVVVFRRRRGIKPLWFWRISLGLGADRRNYCLFIYPSVSLAPANRFAVALHPLFYPNCVRFRFPPPSPFPRGPLMRLKRKGVVGNEISPNPTHLHGGVGERSSAFHPAVRSIRNLQRARCRGLGRTERRRVGFTSSSLAARVFLSFASVAAVAVGRRRRRFRCEESPMRDR